MDRRVKAFVLKPSLCGGFPAALGEYGDYPSKIVKLVVSLERHSARLGRSRRFHEHS